MARRKSIDAGEPEKAVRTSGELLDIAGASQVYGPSEDVFRHFVERGALPFIRLKSRGKKRGRIYFRRSTLDAYFARLERESSRGAS